MCFLFFCILYIQTDCSLFVSLPFGALSNRPSSDQLYESCPHTVLSLRADVGSSEPGWLNRENRAMFPRVVAGPSVGFDQNRPLVSGQRRSMQSDLLKSATSVSDAPVRHRRQRVVGPTPV